MHQRRSRKLARGRSERIEKRENRRHLLRGRRNLDTERRKGSGGEPDQAGVRPHHALRMTGRAAGVKDPEIVGGTFAASRRHRRRDDVLVSVGPIRALAVTDMDPPADLGEVRADSVEPLGERLVEEDRLRIAVVDQVGELVLHIAVIHIARRGSELERGELRLEVLVAVVERARDVVACADTVGLECGGELSGSIVELCPCACDVAMLGREPITMVVGDDFPGGSQIDPHRGIFAQRRSSSDLIAWEPFRAHR